MIRIATSFAFLILLSACPGCDAGKSVPVNTDEWVTHQDGNLKVRLPFKPKLRTQNLKHPQLGNIEIKMYICEISRKKAFLVSQIKYPVDPKIYNVAAGLKGAVQGMAQETDGKIESEKDIKLGGLPGKETVVTAKVGLVSKARIFIDGKGPTLYQFQAIGEKSFLKEKSVTDFFESIEITPLAKSGADKKGKASSKK